MFFSCHASNLVRIFFLLVLCFTSYLILVFFCSANVKYTNFFIFAEACYLSFVWFFMTLVPFDFFYVVEVFPHICCHCCIFYECLYFFVIAVARFLLNVINFYFGAKLVISSNNNNLFTLALGIRLD